MKPYLKNPNRTNLHTFTAALFVTMPKYKLPMCLPTDEWIHGLLAIGILFCPPNNSEGFSVGQKSEIKKISCYKILCTCREMSRAGRQVHWGVAGLGGRQAECWRPEFPLEMMCTYQNQTVMTAMEGLVLNTMGAHTSENLHSMVNEPLYKRGGPQARPGSASSVACILLIAVPRRPRQAQYTMHVVPDEAP